MPERMTTLTPGNQLHSLSYWPLLCFFNSCSFSCVSYCALCPFCMVPSCSFPSNSGTSFHTSFLLLLLSAPSSSESLLMFFFSPLVILPLPIFLLLFLWSLAHARFLGHCSSPLFFPRRRWNLPLWQREQKLKVPAKVTRTAFSLFREF